MELTLKYKQELLQIIKQNLFQKQNVLQQAITDITESMNSETKSSLGDKHETARARMQFEQEKLGKQLDELQTQSKDLDRMDVNVQHQKIGFGTLVETNKGIFFISASIGKIETGNAITFAISAQSPLALAMKGLQINESFQFNGNTYSIMHLI